MTMFFNKKLPNKKLLNKKLPYAKKIIKEDLAPKAFDEKPLSSISSFIHFILSNIALDNFKKVKKVSCLSVIFGGLLSMSHVTAAEHQDSQSLAGDSVAVAEQQFSQAELEQVLAPIALYPDTLLTHILIAATYPIEVIDADRFIEQNKHKSAQELAEKAEDKQWDPSVKALLAFPTILANLSKDLAWMRKLGDAFLQDESLVLASIQSLRHKADEAGNLTQMDNVEIVREKRTIIIEPAQAEVVYVPYYDTRVVYGNWHWSHYPPVYWHRPAHYAYYHGPYYWHSGVHIAFDFFFSAFHWNNHHIVRYHHKKRYHHSNRRIATSHHAKRWHHEPSHRQGVAYHSNKVKHRFASHKPSVTHSTSVRKHQHVSERLKVNRAVKMDTQVNRNVKANDKARRHSSHQIVANKRESHRVEMNKGEMNKVERNNTERQKVRAHKFDNEHRTENQHRTKVPQHRVYSHESWKKQQNVNVEDVADKRRSYQSSANANTTASVNYSKQETYKTKGGRSTKQHQRATKNSSSSMKSTSRHQREKHK